MKRIAMFAVLAMSALAAEVRAQTVHGYSKFPIKDPTLVSRAEHEEAQENDGEVRHAYARHAQTAQQQQIAAQQYAAALAQHKACIPTWRRCMRSKPATRLIRWRHTTK